MRTLAVTLTLLLSSHALAADAPAPEKVHKVERLTEHAFVITGKGGNIGLYVGDDHAVLVDTQLAKLVPELLEAIAATTAKPLELVVNTHFHGDHVGGNAAVAPHVHGFVAHPTVATHMLAEQAKLPAAERGGLPTLLVGELDPEVPAHLGIHLPGLALEVTHLRAAHTDGDLIVELPAEHVLQMGDLFFLGILPFVDAEDGHGRFDGLVETIAAVAARVPDDVKIIPGHGPLCGKKELLRYRDFLVAVRAFARAHPGWSSKELAERFEREAWPEWKPLPTFVTWETLFDAATGRGPGRVPRP
jgi:cyclase